MPLRALGLLFFSALAYAAENGTDSIENVLLPLSPIVAGSFLTFSYLFNIGTVGHVLRNITAELMVGNDTTGQDVADIIWDHGADQDPVFSFDFGWFSDAATPEGNYHIRLNGSVFDNLSSPPGSPGTPTGTNLTFRSTPFIMSTTPFACTTPTFTPIVSLADPNYNPLQLGMPSAGQVFFLSNLSTIGNIQVAPNFIDDSFNYGTNPVPQMTMELVESATLKSAGFATINNTQAAYQYLPTDRFTLTAGAWKIRANWTSGNHGGNFTTLSDEFYIATSGPCVGLQTGQSTTGGGSTSSGSGSTKPSGALSSSGISFATLCVLVLTLVAGTVVAL